MNSGIATLLQTSYLSLKNTMLEIFMIFHRMCGSKKMKAKKHVFEVRKCELVPKIPKKISKEYLCIINYHEFFRTFEVNVRLKKIFGRVTLKIVAF